ncbi:MAG: glycoside hydrolase family 3 N-terminal domain-containing protein [Flavobacteriales bacterium]
MLKRLFTYPRLGSLLLIPLFFFSLLSTQVGDGGIVRMKSQEMDRAPPFLKGSHEWADSVLQTLSLRERIGQLFMVAAYSNKGKEHRKRIQRLIEEQKIGGLIFFQGGPLRQAELTDHYQQKSETPLMIGIDGEWGLAMRLDSTIEYPRQMALGAIRNKKLVRRIGRSIGQQCRRLGVHINFAPVMDVNSNSQNPVINERSFGEDPYRVAMKGMAYAKGLQDAGVLATAKHFPGHGDTDKDSHHVLPRVLHDRDRLDSVELYPFRRAVRSGIGGMMVAHLNVPALDSSPGSVSTLSAPIVDGLLERKMGFQGLTFTDALNMNALSDRYAAGKVELKAFMAGNDVLLFPENVPQAIDRIEKAVKNGRISKERVNESCRKILRFKEWAGLDHRDSIRTKGLYQDLNNEEALALRDRAAASAITLLNHDKEVLPVQDLDRDVAAVSVGADTNCRFQEVLDRYGEVTRYSVRHAPSLNRRNSLLEKLRHHDMVVIGVLGTSRSPSRNFGIPSGTVELVQRITGLKNESVLDLFGNPYALSRFYGVQNADGVLVSYDDRSLFQKLSAELIYGGRAAKGVLPVTASGYFQEGEGEKWDHSQRFATASPEEVGLNSDTLERVDSIAREGMRIQAYPGCQILVARNGKIVHHKAYGYHTYEEKRKVKRRDLYDLASITKILASTSSMMKLKDEGKVDLDRRLCDYLPEMVDTCSYQNVVLRDILTHRAGLKPWIPFYKKTLHHGQPDYRIYSTDSSSKYRYRVAEDLYINKHYRDSIYKQILAAGIKPSKEYRYSDLGYYLIMRIIENESGMPLEKYTAKNFYRPLDLETMGYLPRRRFSLDRIVPTEYDMYFRKQLIHGDVHDPGAAMLGGVGGHAGVFSNARDLAVMMQMFLNGGTYGGKRLIEESTIRKFTKCQFCKNDSIDNRRGIGFDKPVRDGGPGPTCHCVSYESFGHSGFTGTLSWADPVEEIVYVFLSNRVYPTAENQKLIKKDIRTRIQKVIHKAIEDSTSGSMELSQQ